MKRRGFLGLAATSLFGARLFPVQHDPDTDAGEKTTNSSLKSETASDWVLEVRNQIPAIREGSYFQTAGLGPSPITVIERVKHLMDVQEKGPANPLYSKLLQDAEDDCRLWIAKTFGAKVEEVALTPNTTEGLDIVLWSINWKTGDEIVISDQEHPALMMPCYNCTAVSKSPTVAPPSMPAKTSWIMSSSNSPRGQDSWL